MDDDQKQEILSKAQEWFRKSISEQHQKNTLKLQDVKHFNVNPFTALYLANFLTGNSDPESIAKALIYPKVLGTSISTTFGNAIQKFITDVLDGFASTTSGIDIEFIDQVDGERKYCQLKSGPNTINKDDITSIANHFKGVINLARTNNLRIAHQDMIVGVIYGSPDELNSFYRGIISNHGYPVIIGNEFWTRLTGDNTFYFDLINSIAQVAVEADFTEKLQGVIDELARSDVIINLSQN